jgi:hypothetical protein
VINLDENFFDKAIDSIKKDSLGTTAKKLVKDGPNIVINLIPESFLSNISYKNYELIHKNDLRPICQFNKSIKQSNNIISFGVPNYGGKHGCCTELTKKGVIEAADTSILKNNMISFHSFQKKLVISLKEYLKILLNDLNVKIPIFFSLTINNIKGCEIANSSPKKIQDSELEYYCLIESLDEIDGLIKKLFEQIINDSYGF